MNLIDGHAHCLPPTILDALREFGEAGASLGPRVATYELTWLHELGYSPALESCAACGQPAIGRIDRRPLSRSPGSGRTRS